MFCRTNFDCDNLEAFFNALGGGQAWRGLRESGKENPYSCVVLAGARSTGERREALQVGRCPAARTALTPHTVQLLAACGRLTAGPLGADALPSAAPLLWRSACRPAEP